MTEKMLTTSFSQVKWLILFSYFIALVLDTMSNLNFLPFPLPSMALLAVLAWTTLLQTQTHLFTAFMLGLLSDSIFNSVLGAHAIIFSLLVFLLLRIRFRFRSYPLWQQSLIILLYFYAAQFMGLILLQPVFNATNLWEYWLSPLMVLILWPGLTYLLKEQTLKAALTP